MLDNLKKCLTLIDAETKVRGGFIAVLMLIAAFLEVLGLGLIYGFARTLLDPASAATLPVVGEYLSSVSADGDAQVIITIIAALLVVFLAKNALLLCLYYTQASFIAMNEVILAKRLLNYYLNGAYFLHLSRNSADLIRNVTGSVTTIFSAVMTAFITLATELVVVTAVALMLVSLEPAYTIGSLLIFSAAVGAFFWFSRRRVQTWGRQEQHSQGEILKALQQGFHSIKEVKILGCEESIRESFIEPRMALAKTRIKFATMTHAPRMWTETVVLIVILLGVIIILLSGGKVDDVFSALVLFAAATFRLLPSMNRIILGMNAIKGGTQAINLVYDDILAFEGHQDVAKRDPASQISFTKELAFDGVSFAYSSDGPKVLEDITLSIRPGESIGFVGPSGAGKTTLIDILAGLLTPVSGTVSVDGRTIHRSAGNWRGQLGYVPQSIYLMDDTVRRNIALGKRDSEIDDEKLANAIRLAQLEDIVANLPQGLETPLGERGVRLSGGQRQRVGIARALYNDPSVLIFDEATSALDSETEHEITNAIQTLKGQKTLIVIAHRLSTVRQCDRLVYMRDGKVDSIGPYAELVENNEGFHKLVKLAQL